MSPQVFAIVVLFCGGQDVTFDGCLAHLIMPSEPISVAECKRRGAADGVEQHAARHDLTERGVTCMTLADLMAMND